MRFRLLLASVVSFGSLFAEQQKQIVAHATTHDEQRQFIINCLLKDVKLIVQNDGVLGEKEWALALFVTYGTADGFRFLCSFFDLMRKECEGIVSIKQETTEFVDALKELKAYMSTYTAKEKISFIPLYMNTLLFYKKYMNCPEIRKLYNLFVIINESCTSLKTDQQQTDEQIKKCKRSAIGAIVSGFVEGGLNALHVS